MFNGYAKKTHINRISLYKKFCPFLNSDSLFKSGQINSAIFLMSNNFSNIERNRHCIFGCSTICGKKSQWPSNTNAELSLANKKASFDFFGLSSINSIPKNGIKKFAVTPEFSGGFLGV